MRIPMAAFLAAVCFAASVHAQIAPADMMSFLVQNSCQPIGAQSFCFAPQQDTDPAFYERRDWGNNGAGYMASDSVAINATAAKQTFRFGPDFDGPVNYAIGDGGQEVAVTNGTAWAYASRDGGTPYTQFFVGPDCGGTGYVFFEQDAPVGSWSSLEATLSDSEEPGACPPLAAQFTRYTQAAITFPFLIDGATQEIGVPVTAVVSEHYDGDSIADASNMERFYFAKGWGWLAWQAWSKTATPTADLPQRCPMLAYGTAPATGWTLIDCRVWSNIVPLSGTWSTSYFTWP